MTIGLTEKYRSLCGWNKHVQDTHSEARLKFKTWIEHNRPAYGYVYEQMRRGSQSFSKSRLKWCQNNQEHIRMDILAGQRASKNFGKFWKSTGKLDVKPGLAVSVEGKSDHGDIAKTVYETFPGAISPWSLSSICRCRVL